MPFSMKLWQVSAKDLHEVEKAKLDDESRLEEWVRKDPSILGIDVLIIGQQVKTSSAGRIDLLGMDPDANLVVLELKRNRTPREVVAQALDYASCVRDLSYLDIDDIAHQFSGRTLKELFLDRYGFPVPENVNISHSIIIMASELDDSSERIVEYLSEQYKVPINVIFFTFFKSAAGEYLGRAWLMDPEEAQVRTQTAKKAPWSGYYFVNVGEGPHRDWDDCRKYGFLSAGQGARYSNAFKRLKEGDRVLAYMKGLGYVGYGVVIKEAEMVREFIPEGQSEPLLSLTLKQPNMAENKDDPDFCEWTIGVEWGKTFSRENAKKYPGIFANQNIVCALRDPQTVDYLRKEFDLE